MSNAYDVSGPPAYSKIEHTVVHFITDSSIQATFADLDRAILPAQSILIISTAYTISRLYDTF